jgi:hypothetical protein
LNRICRSPENNIAVACELQGSEGGIAADLHTFQAIGTKARVERAVRVISSDGGIGGLARQRWYFTPRNNDFAVRLNGHRIDRAADAVGVHRLSVVGEARVERSVGGESAKDEIVEQRDDLAVRLERCRW